MSKMRDLDADLGLLTTCCSANVNVRAQNDGNTPLQRVVQMDGHGLDPEAAVSRQPVRWYMRRQTDCVYNAGGSGNVLDLNEGGLHLTMW